MPARFQRALQQADGLVFLRRGLAHRLADALPLAVLLLLKPTRSIRVETACGSCSNVMLPIFNLFTLVVLFRLFECYLFRSLALQVVHHIRIDLRCRHGAMCKHF